MKKIVISILQQGAARGFLKRWAFSYVQKMAHASSFRSICLYGSTSDCPRRSVDWTGGSGQKISKSCGKHDQCAQKTKGLDGLFSLKRLSEAIYFYTHLVFESSKVPLWIGLIIFRGIFIILSCLKQSIICLVPSRVIKTHFTGCKIE